jgi:hypothetical protein
VKDQLEPELCGLMLHDEKQFIVMRRVTSRVLRRQQSR